MTWWDTFKDYAAKAKEAAKKGLAKADKIGEVLNKTGREPESNLQDLVSKVSRTPPKKK